CSGVYLGFGCVDIAEVYALIGLYSKRTFADCLAGHGLLSDGNCPRRWHRCAAAGAGVRVYTVAAPRSLRSPGSLPATLRSASGAPDLRYVNCIPPRLSEAVGGHHGDLGEVLRAGGLVDQIAAVAQHRLAVERDLTAVEDEVEMDVARVGVAGR